MKTFERLFYKAFFFGDKWAAVPAMAQRQLQSAMAAIS